MLSYLRAPFFLGLAFYELYLVLTLALGSDALDRAAYTIGTELCFRQPGMAYYPALGEGLNQFLCSLNMLFYAGAHGPKPVQLQMGSFGGLFLSTIAIVTYESFRPVHRRSNAFAGVLARASSAFLLVGQRLTAGFTTPLQLVFSTWSTSSGLAATRARRNTDEEVLKALLPESKYIWTTLFAMLGYIVPTLYLKVQDFDYFSLAVWHPFPLYIWALNRVLPPFLRVLPSTPALATTLLTVLCVVVSGVTHYELLRDTVFGAYDLRDVFLLRMPKDTLALAHGAHVLFQVDMVAVLIAISTVVLTSRNLGAFVGKLVPLVLVSAVAGPGAGVIVVWALGEFGLQRAYAKAVKAKKSQ